MSLAAQAEAAALTAFRAASKPGASASVVASLQAGAAEVFERAAKVARDYTGVCVCVRAFGACLQCWFAVAGALAAAQEPRQGWVGKLLWPVDWFCGCLARHPLHTQQATTQSRVSA
jgi:hypothetical protein